MKEYYAITSDFFKGYRVEKLFVIRVLHHTIKTFTVIVIRTKLLQKLSNIDAIMNKKIAETK